MVSCALCAVGRGTAAGARGPRSGGDRRRAVRGHISADWSDAGVRRQFGHVPLAVPRPLADGD